MSEPSTPSPSGDAPRDGEARADGAHGALDATTDTTATTATTDTTATVGAPAAGGWDPDEGDAAEHRIEDTPPEAPHAGFDHARPQRQAHATTAAA